MVKIGEGTFGEAFKASGLVFKIVPMEGSQPVNGCSQKAAADILAEGVIALTLSKLRDEADDAGGWTGWLGVTDQVQSLASQERVGALGQCANVDDSRGRGVARGRPRMSARCNAPRDAADARGLRAVAGKPHASSSSAFVRTDRVAACR